MIEKLKILWWKMSMQFTLIEWIALLGVGTWILSLAI